MRVRENRCGGHALAAEAAGYDGTKPTFVGCCGEFDPLRITLSTVASRIARSHMLRIPRT
jgi:hypothetical protein